MIDQMANNSSNATESIAKAALKSGAIHESMDFKEKLDLDRLIAHVKEIVDK